MNEPPGIWIVDDSADYRFLIQQFIRIKYPAYRVTTFVDGRDLFDTMPSLEQLPILLLLDLHMPRLNGYQTLRQIKNHPDHCVIPIAMVSAEASSHDISSCYKAGVNSFVKKTPDFLQKVDVLCRYWLQVSEATIYT